MYGFFNQASHLSCVAVGQAKGAKGAAHVEVIEEENEMSRIPGYMIGFIYAQKIDHEEAHTIVVAASVR